MKRLQDWSTGGKSADVGGKPMPAKSAAQKRLMDAAAHNPAFAKKVGIPTKVAKEFSSKSKGMSFQKGGEMKDSKKMAKKEIAFMQKKGAPKSMIKHEKEEYGMKKGGNVKKYAMGGPTMGARAMPAQSNKGGAMRGLERAAAMSGRTMPTTGRPTGMKSGGLAAGHKSADGVAVKGKTKAKQVAMRKGGMCK